MAGPRKPFPPLRVNVPASVAVSPPLPTIAELIVALLPLLTSIDVPPAGRVSVLEAIA